MIDEHTYSNDPPKPFSAQQMLDAVDELAWFIAEQERFEVAASELRRIDFWGTSAPYSKGLEELRVKLAGRMPLYHSEPLLEPGTLMWIERYLPWVFVAPDVFDKLSLATQPIVT